MTKNALPVQLGPILEAAPSHAIEPRHDNSPEVLAAYQAVKEVARDFESLPDDRRNVILNAEQFILFKVNHENSEYRQEKDYLPMSPQGNALVRRLKELPVEVAFDTTSRPGFPYYEFLIAIIPAGTGLALSKFLADIFVEWLRGRNSREIEIKLKSGALVKLKGSDATKEQALALLAEAQSAMDPQKPRIILPTDREA